MKRTTNTRAAKAASDERATGPRVRCAIYTRKSTDENLDNDFNSLDAQRESAEMYIRSQSSEGWQALPDRYDDGAYSGATLERPALQCLLADVEAGRIDTIVVYKIDRFSRSLLDFTKLIERLEVHHVSLVSVTQQFNTTTSMGRLTLNILLSFAQFERELSAERIRDKIGAARRRGKYIGGIPPLGYSVDHERKRLVVDPVEATLVRTIFLRYRELGSLVALVRELNGKRILTKSWSKRDGTARDGVPWHKGNLGRLLHNPLYIGLVRHHDQTFPGEQESIIERSLWDDVQAALAANSRQLDNAARGSQPALLKGLLRCGHCDAPMGLTFTRARGDDRTYRYYTCHRTANQSATDCPVRSLPARVVEGAVIDQLRGMFRAPELVARTLRLPDAHPMVGALASLDPIWENLFPAEQERLVFLLVETMVVYPDHLEMALSRDGLRALVAEMEEKGGGHAPLHRVA
jgi:DNA invertase Pin-like site-specific DNA recombinase